METSLICVPTVSAEAPTKLMFMSNVFYNLFVSVKSQYSLINFTSHY